MHPEVWGKHFWRVIHLTALGYPMEPSKDEKVDYVNFYVNMGKILPCAKCRRNYKRHLNNLPLNFFLDNRHELFKWTVHLHNIVNKETGKLQWSLEFAENYYHSMIEKRTLEIRRSGKRREENIVMKIVMVTTVILLLITLYFLITTNLQQKSSSLGNR